MFFQGTLNHKLDFEGIGIHSGSRVKVSLIPAPVDTGIVFIPAGQNISEGVRALVKNLLYTNNAITIGLNGFSVRTIEHFMAVFYALDITNLYILVDGYELPALDGSSKQIIEEIKSVGIHRQNALGEVFYVPYPIWVENGGSYLVALPGDDLKVTYTIDFTSKSNAVGTQTAHFKIDEETFVSSIASARTFGFYEDIDAMKMNNLALGGSLDNALIYTKDRLMNEDLRFANECVRHKILDLVGDLSLIGCKVKGHFIAHKAGHSMDMELVKKVDRVIRRVKVSRNISSHIVHRKEREFIKFKRKVNL